MPKPVVPIARLPSSRLARAVDRAMVRHHHVRVVAELEQRVVGEAAARAQLVELFDQRDRIDHRAVADHADLARMQRAGRESGAG